MTEKFQSVCRMCGGEHLTPAFTLGQENAWVFCGDAEGQGGCGLLQRAHATADGPQGRIEKGSWTEQHRLRSVVSGALEMISTRDGFALDLGCGDGTLLAGFPRWMTPVGVDERMSRTGSEDWGISLNSGFLTADTQATLGEIAEDGFDVITAIGFLETQDRPAKILDRIRANLAEDGVAIIETAYSALALTRTLTSPFSPENKAVYSLSNLEKLAAAAHLRIVRGAMTERGAGSIRLYLVHEDYHGHDYQPWLDMLARLWDEESSLRLQGRSAFQAYIARLGGREREIASMVDAMIRADEHAYVLGTCGATVATLAASGIGYEVISAHIGDNAIPGFPDLITEKEARNAPADVLIAPAWRRRESLEQWYDEIMAGMRLVFLEPELLVVDRQNYAAELGRALAVTDGPGSVETLRAALAAMRGPGLRLVSERTISSNS